MLVGFNTADDAGVYRLSEHQALVQTVDFFPPIVDDPYQFGRIAAANALSDIYAMGGRPLTALNIVCFPSNYMPPSVLTDVLRGGMDALTAADTLVVGGHSVKDAELKYGVALTGLVDPARMITNAGARPGDKLFLTKPLGTGIITTGIKRGRVDATLTNLVIEQMAALNRRASELMITHGAHAATDITGFGLIGHACELAEASGVSLKLMAEQVPLLPEARSLAGQGMNPGGANDNRKFFEGRVTVKDGIKDDLLKVLYDPQTSGGLLMAVAAEQAEALAADLSDADLPAQVIGEVVASDTTPIIVTP